jgi:hypothetical protein
VALAHRRGHGHPVREHAHHQHDQAVHVERERGRRAPLRDLLGHQAVRLVVGAQAPVSLGDAERQQPLGPQVGVVVERERGVAIVPGGAGREALEREPARAGDQRLLSGRRNQVHGTRILVQACASVKSPIARSLRRGV